MTRKKQVKEVRTTTRCAIYTRKSTEEGLEQDFNSLDAQRESAEAYIASQRSEGWLTLPDHYDDGGFSGGDIERPALKRLLLDIQAGKIDCVVVYKVDRLSRSLMDFARIVDIFEKHRVSFVSVTQHFNTTHSMGRLTLNILLSFAQFEREIIAERIRDKIAAQRRKGRWSGCSAPLGYDIDRSLGRVRLVVNPEEAARVRKIFELYLHLQALLPVVHELERRGWKNKYTTLQNGQPRGGRAFDKVSLQFFLRNPIYIGKLRFDGELYDGEHEALISPELFEKVGAQLHQNAKTGGVHVRNKYGAILKGLLYCTACGTSMIHSYSNRGPRRYRYYRCGNAIHKGRRACPVGTVSAPEIERLVVNQIQQLVTDTGLRREVLRQSDMALNREISEFQTQERQVARVLSQQQAELSRLAGRGTTGVQTTARMAELHDLIAKHDLRLEELRLKQSAVEKRRLVERDVVAAFSDFESLWQNLTIREQVQITRLLVARVDFDVHESEVAVTYHPLGIAALAQKRNEDAA